MEVPSDTRSLLKMLEEMYPDRYEVEVITTEEYYKKAGVIELLRTIRQSIGSTELKDINTRN